MKLKRRSKGMLSKRLDSIRDKVTVYKTPVRIIVHLKKVSGVWNKKQCIVMKGTDTYYDGVEIHKLASSTKIIKLEDLSTAQQTYLLGELV